MNGSGRSSGVNDAWIAARAQIVVLAAVVLLAGAEEIAAAGRVLARGKGFVVEQSQVDDLVVEQKVLLQGMGRRVTEDE